MRKFSMILAVGAIALAGCGDDNDDDAVVTTVVAPATSSTTTPGPPTVTTPTTTTPDSSEKTEYEAAIQTALIPIATTFTQIGEQIRSADDIDEVAERLGEAKTVIEKAAADVRSVTPPADISDVHTKAVDLTSKTATDVDEAFDAADGGDQSGLQSAARKIQADGQAFQDLSREYQAKGYDL